MHGKSCKASKHGTAGLTTTKFGVGGKKYPVNKIAGTTKVKRGNGVHS